MYFQQVFYTVYAIDELPYMYIVSFGDKVHNFILI